MAKPIRITNPRQLEGLITNKLANELFFQSNIQDKIAEAMHDKIISNVYDAFEPEQYQRRANSGGFSDMNNMEFTSVDVSNGQVRFIFENTTEGNDSMSGQELTEMFETGDRDSWDNPDVYDKHGRLNSKARPFIEDTVKQLNDNKGELAEALKQDLRRLGFEVK